MPTNTKVHRCVESVKRSGKNGNPYAICQAATGQSYATGEKLSHFEGASPHASWLEAHYASHGLGAIPQAVGGSPRANAMHGELAAMQRGMARGG